MSCATRWCRPLSKPTNVLRRNLSRKKRHSPKQPYPNHRAAAINAGRNESTSMNRHEPADICDGPAVNIEIDIQNACSRAVPDDADFTRWLEAAIGDERDIAEVSLRIVDADEINALNHQYRGKAYATNVLSFPADLPAELELPLLGDIVICAEVVEREASEQPKSVEAHWAHRVGHGALP